MDLDGVSPDSEEIYIPRRLSANLATVLLGRFPKLRRILVPPSVFQMVSPRVLDALKNVGVEVVPTGRPRGRPLKYPESLINEICSRYSRGESASEIARNLGVPERSVYYILCKRGLAGR